MMDESIKNDLLIKTAKLYFEEGFSQARIAEVIGFSRPYVSKLIAEAQERGIVTIKVHDSIDTESPMEKKLRMRFNLLRVFEVHSNLNESAQYKIGSFTANYLPTILRSGDTIAVDNGNTIYRCACCMGSQPTLENITVVQLGGSFTNLSYPTYSQHIPMLLASALNGVGVFFPAPVIINDDHTREQFLKERSIIEVIELQKQANVALFTVDGLSMGISSNIVNSSYISPRELDDIAQRGAVGSICNHFISSDGNLFDAELDRKVLSLSLNELMKKKYRICIATGRAKYKSVYAALQAGYANILITDDDTTKALSIMSN